MDNLSSDDIQSDIAIIGMSGRFPKAKSLYQFWHNLREGRECISFFSDEDLPSGVNPTWKSANPKTMAPDCVKHSKTVPVKKR